MKIKANMKTLYIKILFILICCIILSRCKENSVNNKKEIKANHILLWDNFNPYIVALRKLMIFP